MSAVSNMSRGFRFTLDERDLFGESEVRLAFPDRYFATTFRAARWGFDALSQYDLAWAELYTFARTEGYLP